MALRAPMIIHLRLDQITGTDSDASENIPAESPFRSLLPHLNFGAFLINAFALNVPCFPGVLLSEADKTGMNLYHYLPMDNVFRHCALDRFSENSHGSVLHSTGKEKG